MRRLILAALLALGFANGAVAQTVTAAVLSPIQSLVPLNNFGFACSNTAAQNTTAYNLAKASGFNAFSIKNCATPYRISATLQVTDGETLVGESVSGVTIQPPTNTAGVNLIGANIWAQGFTVQYASPEPAANTAAIGLSLGGSTFLYYSHVQDIAIINANTAIGATGTNGEFQNSFYNMRTLTFSKYGIYEPGNTSGSVWINTRVQNESSLPSGPDCTTGVLFTNAFNTVFDILNEEYMDCSSALLAVNQSELTINGLHWEQINQPDYTQMISQNYQSFLSINNFSIQNSTINDAHGQIDNLYASGSTAGSNTLLIDGFIELGNTFTGKLALFGDDGNYNKVYLRGVSGRNSGNVVIASRNDLVQIEGYTFDAPGGRALAGCAGTAAPAGAMPLPFMSTAGVALPWSVGDRCNNSAPTATSTTGWRNTTAGSPGTWTAEPVL
jgi:hypothetical protein